MSESYIAELEKKVKRLENYIKAFGHEEYSNSIEESEAYIKELYTGVDDEQINKTIEKCIEENK